MNVKVCVVLSNNLIVVYFSFNKGSLHAGLLCKHIMRVYSYNNIFVLPAQYILNRWTKYAKKKSIEKYENKGSLASRCTYISRKMISVALQCSDSEKAVEYLEDSFNKWASGIEDFLSHISLDDNEVPQCSFECTEDFAKTRVSFRIPSRMKGPMQQRKRHVLERGNQKSSKSTTKKGQLTKLSLCTACIFSIVTCQHFSFVIISGGGKRKSSKLDLDGHSEVGTRELTNVDEIARPPCVSVSPQNSEFKVIYSWSYIVHKQSPFIDAGT